LYTLVLDYTLVLTECVPMCTLVSTYVPMCTLACENTNVHIGTEIIPMYTLASARTLVPAYVREGHHGP